MSFRMDKGFHIDFILPWTNTKAAELYHPSGIGGNRTSAPCWFDKDGEGLPDKEGSGMMGRAPEEAYTMVYERTDGEDKYIIVMNPSARTVRTSLVPGESIPVSQVGKYTLRKGVLTVKGTGAVVFKCPVCRL